MSKSPKRSASAQKQTKNEEALLDARIENNKLEYPSRFLFFVGLCMAFAPAFLCHAVYHVSWTSVANMPLYIAVPLATAYMLGQAYSMMITSEFWKRQPHYSETRDEDAKLLKKLRLTVAVGYSMFFINGVFIALSTLLQAYIFRHADPRASFMLSPTMAAAILWFIAQKNEETRKRRK